MYLLLIFLSVFFAPFFFCFFFFFNDTATTEIYTLSLHDALPITRRFLGGYAPATPEDLTRWWLGPPRPRQGAAMLAAAGDEAAEVTVGGKRAWVLARDLPGMLSATTQGIARLLPAFDPWVIGAARHAPLFDPPHLARVYRPQGWISPVLLVNGRIAGTWKHTRNGHRLVVEAEPFGRLPAWARKQLYDEA